MTIPSSFISTIKGDVVAPDHPDYAPAISRWAKNAERKAAVVVFVKDSQDVASSIAYAKENALPIAIRGGGHNAAGASSSEDGLVIDLSRHLKSVRVDVEKKLVYVGGGTLWKDVDAETMKYGLATVGGTVNHTGVAGLTLGGGYGYLSGRHGLTIDNLRQVTIVTADGSILTANETENTDLFWGVRGAGSNFGVVTEFVFQLHPQRKTVFFGSIVFTPNQVEKVIQVTQKWWEVAKFDRQDESVYQGAVIGPAGSPVLVVNLFFNGSEEEGRANFKEFFDIGPVADMTKEAPYEELNAMQNPYVPHGKCYYMKGISQKGPHYEAAMQLFNKNLEVHKAGQFNSIAVFEYIPLAKVNSVPVDAMPSRRQLAVNVMFLVQWEDDIEKTPEARKITNELVEIVLNAQGSPPSSTEKMGYTNYDVDVPEAHIGYPTADIVGQKTEAAFGSNYPRLQTIKKKYDPENVFNRWFPITPAA